MLIEQENLMLDDERDRYAFKVPEDTEEAWRLYTTSPVVQQVIDKELHTRQEYIHEVEPRSSYYAVRGMLSELAGETFSGELSDVGKLELAQRSEEEDD